jgi:hypothetical protein
MKILIEGETYSINVLTEVFEDSTFYTQSGINGIVNSVGYYHSFNKNILVYMLPKVFMINGKVFGQYNHNDLFESEVRESFKHSEEGSWARKLSILFYKGLIEFKKRNELNQILKKDLSFEINSNLTNKEYSFIDLVLSFTSFYKKNKNVISFYHKESISNHFKRPSWEKTISKFLPMIDSSGKPIYVNVINKKKTLENEDQLLSCFFSILNHFNSEYILNLQIDKSYNYVTGRDFEKLKLEGAKILKKVKHKYFSDVWKRMYQLCHLYFNKVDASGIKKKTKEYISVKNYNIIFEDMIDKLLTDINDTSSKKYNTSINELKYNKDGKIIDHIYEYPSLIDDSSIFYIGDSKYYKPENKASSNSVYKQFTYAKNIVQFNIDIFNNTGFNYNSKIRYRDELTEGYNISPNFFIFGYISLLNNFKDPLLEPHGKPLRSFHFKNRLFDRDTLSIIQYQINFLFVLNAYTSFNTKLIDDFKEKTRQLFREKFIDYLNDPKECGFELYVKEFSPVSLKNFINDNFKILNGKCIVIKENLLLIAIHQDDNDLSHLINDFVVNRLI